MNLINLKENRYSPTQPTTERIHTHTHTLWNGRARNIRRKQTKLICVGFSFNKNNYVIEQFVSEQKPQHQQPGKLGLAEREESVHRLPADSTITMHLQQHTIVTSQWMEEFNSPTNGNQ